MEEFAIFSAAWLSHDPNDPVCDPNNPGYVSDPNDPDYISQSAKDNWNLICNLEVSGNSEYVIDLGDLASFCEDWLWEACWRENYTAVMYGMSGGGGESMMMAAPMTESLYSAQSLPPESTQPIYEPDPISMEKAILEILDFVDTRIKEGHENMEGCLEMKALLEEWLDEILAQKEQTLDF